VPVDRATTLRQAETLLRQGRLEPAIAEYVRLLEDQPRDWNTANIVGDLLVRAGHLERALEHFRRLAERLRDEGFLPRAFALYKKILTLKPDDDHALFQAGELAAEQGLLADARLFFTAAASGRRDRGDAAGASAVAVRLRSLDERNPRPRADAEPGFSPEAVGSEAALMRAEADTLLRTGEKERALELIDRCLLEQPSAIDAFAALAISVAAAQPDTAYQIADRVVGACVAGRDWSRAADTLTRLLTRRPGDLVALTRLVGVCIDGDLPGQLCSAQVMLVDAYLAAGLATEACLVAEDLVRREPMEQSHVNRLRAALAAGGAADPDRALAEWLADMPTVDGSGEPLREPKREAPHLDEFRAIAGAVPRVPGSAGTSTPAPAASADLDLVFARMRETAAQRPDEELAVMAYTRGVEMLESGELEQSAEHLRSAARLPRLRHAAAALLAGIHERQGRTADAIDWLGHAADAPGLTAVERGNTLLRLADLLERAGEGARALAVCLELRSDAGGDDTLAARIERLSRAQAGG